MSLIGRLIRFVQLGSILGGWKRLWGDIKGGQMDGWKKDGKRGFGVKRASESG